MKHRFKKKLIATCLLLGFFIIGGIIFGDYFIANASSAFGWFMFISFCIWIGTLFGLIIFKYFLGLIRTIAIMLRQNKVVEKIDTLLIKLGLYS